LLIALSGCGSDGIDSNSPDSPPAAGIIYTTNTAGSANIGVFTDRSDVYLNGGPAALTPDGLPNGSYYVMVTTRNGVILGKSTAPVIDVAGGSFTAVYRLRNILTQTNGSGKVVIDRNGDNLSGFARCADSQYRVLICTLPTFPLNSRWSADFTVNESGAFPQSAYLQVLKFYDANANGLFDSNEQEIAGWKVAVSDAVSTTCFTPVAMILNPGTYTITESKPKETFWASTTPASFPVTLAAGDDTLVAFGNVTLAGGNANSLSFWASNNGKAVITADDLAQLSALHLRTLLGGNFDPVNFEELRDWLEQAGSLYPSYQLSAYLAVMKLNIVHGFVNGNALIHADGAQSANAAGFATVNAILAEVNSELGLHGTATAINPWCAYQLALISVLDQANGNQSFVQSSPGVFTF